MADLKPLIRQRKHLVEEKQRFVAQLYREAEKLERQKAVIEQKMANEIALGKEMGSVEAQAYLGKYLEGARRKVKALEQSIAKMNTRIAAAQEDMRAAFAEMKKIEITQRTRDKKAKAVRKKKEDQELDETAIENYRRREEEN